MCPACKKSLSEKQKLEWVPAKTFFKNKFSAIYAKKLSSEYSLDTIERIKEEISETLTKVEKDILEMFEEVKIKANKYFSNLSTRIQTVIDENNEYQRLLDSCLGTQQVTSADIKKLVDLHLILKDELKLFDLSPHTLPKNLKREAETTFTKFKTEIFPKMTEALNIMAVDFSRLKLDSTFKLALSEGVLYEASDFIPHLNLLALGYRKGQQGSLALWDIGQNKLLQTAKEIHKKWINHVIWVEQKNFIVTCSNDTKIKVFAVRNKGHLLKEIATFRGHKNLVRCVKYIPEEDILISAGDDPNLKVWDLKKFKRTATINTQGQTNMDGSLAYIPQHKLIGVGFRAGFIRFYHIYERTVAFEFKTGFTNFYTYALQYLPKRKMLLGRVKENTIKLWSYSDEKKCIVDEKVITTKGTYPDCILVNEDESQLIFTSRDTFLETYDFRTQKLTVINLSSHIRKTNSLTLLKGKGKVSVCDYTSGTVCLLE